MKISPEQQALAGFAVDTRWEDLPAKVIEGTKLFLMDSVGCGLGGISTDPGRMIIALAKMLGGPEESSIIGVKGKVSCVNAVLANGQLINTLDWESLSGHAPGYIVPPALAMAERSDASGKDLILSTAIGLELSGRVAAALMGAGPFMDIKANKIEWAERQGYAHMNFGVAGVAGRFLNLNKEQMIHALGLAGHMSEVLTWIRATFQDNRAITKYGVPGWQNTGGVMAAFLAEMGAVGDTTVFDTEQGFWKFAGYVGGWHPERILDKIGEEWMFFNRLMFKPFPSCRMFQTETDIFLCLMERNKLKAEDIASIKTYGHPTLLEPAFTSRELNSIVDINFSPAYTLAMAAHGVPCGVDWQDMELARSPRISDFASRIEYTVHPEFGDNQACRVEITTYDGHTYQEERGFNSLHAMTEDDLLKKYQHNARRILTEQQVGKSVEYFQNLEELPRVSLLTAQIT